MKKFLRLLLIPVLTLGVLFGCGKDRTIADVQKLYLDTTTEHVVEDTNLFFSNELEPLSISIEYADELIEAMNAPNPSNDVQKRYKALYYQQKVLDNIFDYYSNNQEDFYMVAGSKDLDKDEINSLYDKLSSLNTTLDEFLSEYNTFSSVIKNGLSEIMEYNITSYSYELNKVIDASFSFMYEFHNLYVNCMGDDFNIYTEKNLKINIDKAYLDMSYLIYLENMKSFNFSVGENGVCDLSKVVESNSTFNLLEMLDNKKSLSLDILDNLASTSADYEGTMQKLDDFTYSRNVFNQKLNSYLTTFSSLDMYTLASYKFDAVSGVDYNSYINSLTASDKATVLMLENFVENCFKNYMDKLDKIVN